MRIEYPGVDQWHERKALQYQGLRNYQKNQPSWMNVDFDPGRLRIVRKLAV